MIWKCIILASIITSVICQYAPNTAMRADVTFDDRNDRFDLTSLIDEQNRQFDNSNIDGHEHRRRSLKNTRRGAIETLMNNLRRYDFSDTNFAFHDDMNSSEGGSVSDFERNLRTYRTKDNRRFGSYVDYLHGGIEKVAPSRRSHSSDPEKEILMHYAVPIDIKINGYFKLPVVE
ncbi:uncharacterized protein LOC113520060 isoform X2 [Galleria mellonella]|uniref:Uncharacterized protein LOC113520060 isoform X2 n=1 Tax=Galleria mellonella TaxID=7137 RepID=A0A6J3CAC7_GALME|nr:uncharacterized protein LOC113520060 isoform X2 [Galleria mellonella]